MDHIAPSGPKYQLQSPALKDFTAQLEVQFLNLVSQAISLTIQAPQNVWSALEASTAFLWIGLFPWLLIRQILDITPAQEDITAHQVPEQIGKNVHLELTETQPGYLKLITAKIVILESTAMVHCWRIQMEIVQLDITVK